MSRKGKEGRALPTFIIIGAQKCGTTGLHVYLSKHPEVSMSNPKELDYFIKERNFGRGFDWYANRFDPDYEIRGEASPNYTVFPRRKGVPRRMAKYVPDVKLIYMVRDPVDRISSHWIHNYALRRERGDMAATINHPRTTYIPRSLYYNQISRYLRHFDREQILILDQYDLRHNRDELLREVFAFIGADPDFTDDSFDRQHHLSSNKRRASRAAAWLAKFSRRHRWMPDQSFWISLDKRIIPGREPIPRLDVASALTPESIAMIKQDAEQFRQVAGRDFAHWSIWEM